LASGREPIDSLQVLFNAWQQATGLADDALNTARWELFPSVTGGAVQLRAMGGAPALVAWRCYDATGACCMAEDGIFESQVTLDAGALPHGIYWIQLLLSDGRVSTLNFIRE
jgi:hypothetical protein